MWLSDRRTVLLGALATLGACGFTPAYAPGGSGQQLLGRIALDEPKTKNGYRFGRRFEERLGRSSGPFRLSVKIQVDRQGLGSTSAGATTRFRFVGRALYSLRDAGDPETVLLEGRTNAFTGYSTTGSTVATLAAQRDAEERLMIILADQVIDQLLIDAPRLSASAADQ